MNQLLGEQPVDDGPDVLAEVRTNRSYLSIDTGLHLTGEEGIAVTLLRAATLPCHMITDEAHRAACLVARGIETVWIIYVLLGPRLIEGSLNQILQIVFKVDSLNPASDWNSDCPL